MCLFGSTETNTKTANGPVSKGPSDQSEPLRDEAMSRNAQQARDPLGRGGNSGVTGSARRKANGGATLLTAGAVDTTGKKTLLGA
jgi:hypothetical protein